MNIGEKIRLLRKQKGISPEKLGMLADLSGQYIRKLEKGVNRSITLQTAQKLADGLGVKPEAFFNTEDLVDPLPRKPSDALQELEQSIKAYIPVYGKVHANDEGIIAESIIDYVATTRIKTAPETLRAYRVEGLCLEPGVIEGDTVIIDTSRSPVDTNLVICIIDGKASIKRYREDVQGNKWLENNGGRMQPEECHMHGVVIQVLRNLV
jgi:transcriptional regulator with XRE-family HTH domain